MGHSAHVCVATTFSNSSHSEHKPNHKSCSEILKPSKTTPLNLSLQCSSRSRVVRGAIAASLAAPRSTVSASSKVFSVVSTASVTGATTASKR